MGLVALALMRSRQETLLATRERGNFLDDLFSGRAPIADAAGTGGRAWASISGSGSLLPLAVVAG